jgi:hypothetical protein
MVYQLAHLFGLGRRLVRRRPLHQRRGRLQGTPRRARAEALRSRLSHHHPC